MKSCHLFQIVALAAVLIASAGQMQAAVINGGFETGDLTGWTVSGADSAVANPSNARSGSYSFVGYDNDGFATLSQNFSTLAGAEYELDFWSFSSFVDPGNILRYQLDAGPIFTVSQTPTYALTTGSFTASGSTTTLSFLFETDDGTGVWLIDDVSVTQTSAAVPEPTSMAIFGLGALGLAYRARRKSKCKA